MIDLSSHQSLFALVKDNPSERLPVNHRKTMSWLSRAIELVALKAEPPVRVFSGFQSMQFFLPVMARYEQLAARAQVYVYGYPDITPPAKDNINYVRLEKDDPLVNEWFIVVDSPNFCHALVTEDQSGLSQPHERRTFKGLLSYERGLVARLDEALSRQIRVPLADPTEMTRPQRVLVMDFVGHLQRAIQEHRNDPVLLRELNLIVNRYLASTFD